jgi:hypothetical protein
MEQFVNYANHMFDFTFFLKKKKRKRKEEEEAFVINLTCFMK